MGCLESRQGMKRAEFAIATVEKVLGYGRVTIRTVDMAFHRFSQDGVLSEDGLKNAAQILYINVDGIDDDKTKIHKYYN